jgi:hypothetical protein
MFGPARPFWQSLMFTGKTRSLLLKGAPEKVEYGLT